MHPNSIGLLVTQKHNNEKKLEKYGTSAKDFI